MKHADFIQTYSGKFGKPKVTSQVQPLKIQQNIKKKCYDFSGYEC
jgi:hypothetical protein